MDIEIFGGGERVRIAARLLSRADFSSAPEIGSIKLFPIPTSRDGRRVTGTELLLSELLEKTEKNSFAVGYAFPPDARKIMEEKGIRYYDGARDEEFLLENAYVSAIGALCYLLGSTPCVPEALNCGIVGYGRIGSALSRMLLFLGAKIRIFSSKPLTRVDLGEVGVKTSEIKVTGFDFDDLSELDILINTAPCDLSGAFPEKKLHGGLRVIDLASGDSFPGVEGVEYLPSIPDRMYPESAGKAYARHALKAVMKK